MTVGSESRTVDGRLWRLSRRRWIIFFIAIAMMATVFGHSLWLPFVGDFLIVADPLEPADAVVTLGGGERERVAHAALLFDQGYADWFVVTNAQFEMPGVRASYGELMQQEAIWQGVVERYILIVPGVVETTYDEAIAVRGLAQGREWHSLIVVTDPYHTRRARIAFREVFKGSGITVAVQPVNEHEYRADSWWQSRDGLRETWTEYAKLVLHLTGYK